MRTLEMKTNRNKENSKAFTLVELLVVIGIIGILAGLISTAVVSAKKKALVASAQVEIKNLVGAISKYESEYNRYPCPTNAAEDATIGLNGQNAAIIDILRDIDSSNNPNHARNPRRVNFIDAKLATSTNMPGIGPDGTWRDPWGRAYIITIDYNYDNVAKDAIYGDIQTPVVVWSLGPNPDAKEDDIKSWTSSKR
ncbi:MAG: prepilin-type N-terminal cleavage/methylation domain-containing protein [Verrucomicrobiae bacterium]|nr:prepilin-type N-terminal cleavage/methylation domain-containing protein [Verrucomicrobiae bacterium]